MGILCKFKSMVEGKINATLILTPKINMLESKFVVQQGAL